MSAAVSLGLALGLAGAASADPSVDAGLPRGEVVERVACRADPTKSYALYLLSEYDASRAWPVVFALDPAARGRVPVERFRERAEAHGYVVARSNDSRNGPLEPSARAVAAVIQDARSRLRLDERRAPAGRARVAVAHARQDRRRGGDGARAALFFETAMRASVLDPRFQNDTRVWLACARARAGDAKRALQLLREAVAAGFDDREFLQEEPSLASLRARPEFQETLRSLPEVPPVDRR